MTCPDVVRTIEVVGDGPDCGRVAGSIHLWRDEELDAPGRRLLAGAGALGRGIATAALRAFLDIVTGHPLHGRTTPTNPASRRVLEHARFRLVRVDEGVPATDGRLVDEAM